METPISFAPLAGRLAAHAAKIRPMDGARNDWDKIGALIMCLVLEMLIALCEALDARAAAEAAGFVAAPASRDVKAAAVPALRAGRQAPSSEKRAFRLALVPEIQATIPSRAAAPSRTAEHPKPATPRLAWSRDPDPVRAVLAPPWRPHQETRPFFLPSSTPILLRYRNEKHSWQWSRRKQIDMSHTQSS